MIVSHPFDSLFEHFTLNTYVIAPINGRIVGAADPATSSRAGTVARLAGDTIEV